MKKLLLSIMIAAGVTNAFAQDAKVGPKERKKFRMGLLISPGVDWFTTSTNGLELDAARVKFGAGVTGELAFANNYALTFGLEYKGAGGALAYENAYYYSQEDDKPLVQLNTRNYRYDYINIPIMLKLMTNEIGYFTYFGQVGVDFAFLASAKSTDKGMALDSSLTAIGAYDRDYRDVYSSSSFANIRLRVGAGAEWNFSGNTSLIFSVNYHHGFIDVLRDSDIDSIRDEEGIFQSQAADLNKPIAEKTPFAMRANLHYVSLNVGILF